MKTPQALPFSLTDPYARWAQATSFAGMPFNSRVPLLIDLSSYSAANVARIVQYLDKCGVFVSPENWGTHYLTAYVKPDCWVALTDILSRLGIRWELGAPYASETNWRIKVDLPTLSFIGRKVVGVIDYGCAFAHRQFRRWNKFGPEDPWSTRIAALWDQGADSQELKRNARRKSQPFRLHWRRQPGFGYGAEVIREDIDARRDKSALGLDSFIRGFERNGVVDEEACYAHSGYVPIQTATVTHGTFVTDLAAGWPDPLGRFHPSQMDSPNVDIVFVQLPRFFAGVQVAGLLRTYVLDAVRYIFRCAGQDADVTINLSYGAHAGPHDGSSLLEMALDEAVALRKQTIQERATHIVIASGNGHEERGHARQSVAAEDTVSLVVESIPDNPTDQFVEIWLDAEFPAVRDGCQIRLIPPGQSPNNSPWLSIGEEWSLGGCPGEQAMVIAPRFACQSPNGRLVLLALAPTAEVRGRMPSPYGRWALEVRNLGRTPVLVNAWCERDEPVFGSASAPRQIRFAPESAYGLPRSLNSMGHGRNSIIVGGLVGGSMRVPAYVGRGPGRCEESSRYPVEPPAPGKPADSGKPGPEWLAIAEESDVLPGLAAAAVFVNERVRLNGTSAATARATRYLADGNHVPPPSCAVDMGGVACTMPCVPEPGFCIVEESLCVTARRSPA